MVFSLCYVSFTSNEKSDVCLTLYKDEDENDEFSHFHDEEEFIGFDSERPQGARMPKTQEEPKITIANVSVG